MKLLKSAVVVAVFGLQLMACGGGSSDEGRPQPSPVPGPGDAGYIDESSPASVDLLSHMVFDRYVSATARESLSRDLKRIERFDLTTNSANDEKLKSLLNVQDLSASTMSDWLKARIRYFLAPEISKYRLGTVMARSKSYRLFSLPELDSIETENMAAAMMGTALYQYGKQLRDQNPNVNYVVVEVNNAWVHANSQRNGIMQIGPALFNPKYMVNAAQPQAYANTALRVETLFHEARHADGNEVSGSYGFSHIDCPSGAGIAKEFVGQPACDNNANGPYTIGAEILKAYIAKCGAYCSVEDRTVLEGVMLDSLSRVVKRSNGLLPVLDPTPEKGFAKVDISNFSLLPTRAD